MPFKKGDSNINRNGRPPRGESWSELIREFSNRTDDGSGKQFRVLVVERLFQEAIAGDLKAIKEIADRVEGKPRQTSFVESNQNLEGLVIIK